MKKKLIGNLLAIPLPLMAVVAYAGDAVGTAANVSETAAPTTAGTDQTSTSNTTRDNATQREQEQLSEVTVQASRLSLGGGLMSIQDAPKAVSTISRDAILQAAPGATYAQMIQSIPGVLAITDDVTGLNDANYSIRGFTNDEIGVTVNGAPINDSGNYRIYPTEYGDTENMGDITVLQGYPDVDQPVAGAAGGTIAWVTIDPSHTAKVDTSFSAGSYGYLREFARLQTGDLGPVRGWVSYSHNEVNLWRGLGNSNVDKIDGKLVWDINDNNTISASVQYNHEMKFSYNGLSIAQADANYYQNYDDTFAYGDTNYWRLHTNPFANYLVSLDGEFHLTTSTRLSVVPYYYYAGGGGGGGTKFTESTATKYYGYYGYSDQDVDNSGTIGGSAAVYDLAESYTWRDGVIAKLIQQIGRDDSVEVGFWTDQPRQEQAETFEPTSGGVPVGGNWNSNPAALIPYSPNGAPQYLYNEYTKTSLWRGFLDDTYTPTNWLTLTAGVAYTTESRKGYDYEYYGAESQSASYCNKCQFGGPASNSYDATTPTAGMKFQLNEQNQLYAGWGRTWRAPINGSVLQNEAVLQYYATNPSEISYSKITPEQLAAIAQNQPETADTIDTGWRYYANRVSASVDLYGSNLKNKQVSGYDSASGQTVYLSVPMLHQRGVDAEASFKLTDALTVYGSYAYTVSKFAANLDTIGDGIYPVDGKTFLDTPKNTAYLRLNYDHGPAWASLDLAYRSSIWGDWMNTQSVGGYTTLNFNTGWRFDDLGFIKKPEIKLNLFNLTDKHALTFDSATTLMASNPSGIKDVNGNTLYAAGAYYNLLEPRSVMVTFSASID